MQVKNSKHLVFYDGKCGFCDHVVSFLLKQDKAAKFVFAPLQGVTAAQMLKNMPQEVILSDSLILVENYGAPDQKIYLYGKGAFRIAWLLGGKWALVGWLSFLPGFLYNWGYRLVAANRYRFSQRDICELPDRSQKDRFLP